MRALLVSSVALLLFAWGCGQKAQEPQGAQKVDSPPAAGTPAAATEPKEEPEAAKKEAERRREETHRKQAEARAKLAAEMQKNDEFKKGLACQDDCKAILSKGLSIFQGNIGSNTDQDKAAMQALNKLPQACVPLCPGRAQDVAKAKACADAAASVPAVLECAIPLAQ